MKKLKELKKKKVNKKVWINFFIFKYKWYCLVFLPLIILSIILSKTIELIPLLIGFWLFRYMFPTTLHIQVFKYCIFSSLDLLTTGLIICIPKNISIYSSCIFSLILCFSLYIIEYILKNTVVKNELKSNRDKIRYILKDNVTQERIFEYCKNKGLKDKVADTVDLYMTNTIDEVCEIMGTSPTAVKKRIKLFINKQIMKKVPKKCLFLLYIFSIM